MLRKRDILLQYGRRWWQNWYYLLQRTRWYYYWCKQIHSFPQRIFHKQKMFFLSRTVKTIALEYETIKIPLRTTNKNYSNIKYKSHSFRKWTTGLRKINSSNFPKLLFSKTIAVLSKLKYWKLRNGNNTNRGIKKKDQLFISYSLDTIYLFLIIFFDITAERQ